MSEIVQINDIVTLKGRVSACFQGGKMLNLSDLCDIHVVQHGFSVGNTVIIDRVDDESSVFASFVGIVGTVLGIRDGAYSVLYPDGVYPYAQQFVVDQKFLRLACSVDVAKSAIRVQEVIARREERDQKNREAAKEAARARKIATLKEKTKEQLLEEIGLLIDVIKEK